MVAAVIPTVATLCLRGAHQLQPPVIALWGPFSKPTLQCLRTLHRAEDDCLRRVIAAHHNCFGRQLTGLPCDTSARDAHIAAATRRVEQEVDRGCLGGQLTELFFRTYDDAKFDLTNACTTQALLQCIAETARLEPKRDRERGA